MAQHIKTIMGRKERMISVLKLFLMLSVTIAYSSPPTFDFMFPDSENSHNEALDISKLKEEFLTYIKSFFNTDLLIQTNFHDENITEKTVRLLDCVLSIELGENLYNEACKRFKNCPKVRLFHGESGDIIGDVISCANGRILFWLDGRYLTNESSLEIDHLSLIREVTCIEKSHTIDSIMMIDDATTFQNSAQYRHYRFPQLQEVLDKITDINAEYRSYFNTDMLITFANKNIDPSVIQPCVRHHLSDSPKVMPILLGDKRDVSPHARNYLLKLHRVFGAEEQAFCSPCYTE